MAAEMQIINPYDNRVITSVPVFSEGDVRAAVERATAAASTFALMPTRTRAAVLYRAATILEDHADSLARLLARESGKPLRLAHAETRQAAEIFGLAAAETIHTSGETLDWSQRMTATLRAPAGVVAAITSFARPLEEASRWLAPAVAAGCPLVLRPAPETPLTTLRLTDILEEAGLPAGVFEVVLGGDDAARWLATDERIAHIAFIGRADEAAPIVRAAGLRRVSLELHGSVAAIINADAHLSRAAAQCAAGVFAYSGQMDSRIRRIYAHRSVYDEFRQQFLDAVGGLVIGNPMQPDTDIGPLISDTAAEHVTDVVNGAIEEGAWLLAGGERSERLVEPVVLENVDESMQIMQAAVAGPVAGLLPFDRFEATLAAFDGTGPGVHLGVFTQDIDRALHALRCLHIDTVTMNAMPARPPSPEGIRRTVDALSTLKTVVLDTRI